MQSTEDQLSAPTENVMDDFVFGGIEADDAHLLATMRRQAAGLRHHHEINPPDPQPNEEVCITVYSGPATPLDRVTAYVTIDGSLPAGRRGVAHVGMAIPLTQIETRWEPTVWDYIGVWQGIIPGQSADGHNPNV
ncbi:MAG: hypothetical protein R2932_12890 [Caldilineaceae bacterium]